MQQEQIVRHAVVLVFVTGAIAAVFAGPPIPQPLAYHQMADQRSWVGIPNALNVLSNLPFAVVGVAGLALLFGSSGRRVPFRNPWERWPYAVLFTGLVFYAAASCSSLPTIVSSGWDE